MANSAKLPVSEKGEVPGEFAAFAAFTFQTPTQQQRQQRLPADFGNTPSSSAANFEQYARPWDSPRIPSRDTRSGAETPDTNTVADGSIGEDDHTGGDGDAGHDSNKQSQQALGGNHNCYYHHHHHHHHYHYHVGKLHHASRRRYPQTLFPRDAFTPEAAAAPAETAPDFQHEGSAGNSADDNFPLPPALDQDPLLSWDSSNQDSIHAFPGANAWLASASLSLQGTNQEWNTPAESDLVRRWSQRRSTLDSILNDDEEFNRHNPHWDDMITFRQTRVRVPRERAWSGSEASLQGSGDALLAHGNSSSSSSKGWRLLPMATNMAGRTLCLTVLPVVAVLLWCSVPLKTDTVVLDDGRDVERLNFWFFLFFYYGIYNAVALALVTQIFHIYSLTWWPRSMSGLSANIISWVFSIALGALIYMMDTGIEKEPLMWTGLTLLTLLLPVFISFVIIQKHHRRSRRRRHHASEDQPLMANTSEWRTPSSYRRFLWFCTSFMLWYAALTAGEYLAYIYIETLPHRTADGFFYVYSWIATVSILSGAANWVVGTKIRSWPLQNIYLLYFFMTYFIFYRNLFARLQNPEQVVFLQLGSSLWVVFIYPVRMAKWVYRVMAYFGRWGDDYPYEVYAKQLGRTFFLRNKAENATMLGFLFWVTILHFGPNSRHYPYFLFKSKDDEFDYSYSLTIRASIYVWVSEIISSRIVRCLFRWIYKQDIGSEAVYDFRRYPHVVPVMVLVTIHVLQNILFGLIHLDFS